MRRWLPLIALVALVAGVWYFTSKEDDSTTTREPITALDMARDLNELDGTNLTLNYERQIERLSETCDMSPAVLSALVVDGRGRFRAMGSMESAGSVMDALEQVAGDGQELGVDCYELMDTIVYLTERG